MFFLFFWSSVASRKNNLGLDRERAEERFAAQHIVPRVGERESETWSEERVDYREAPSRHRCTRVRDTPRAFSTFRRSREARRVQPPIAFAQLNERPRRKLIGLFRRAKNGAMDEVKYVKK